MNNLRNVIGNDAFLEASKEELRVLITLLECPGASPDEIAEICAISRTRASSAISFWRESGVFAGDITPTITSEFEERLMRGELDEERSIKVAKDIKEFGLASVIDECARLMKKNVSTTDVKKISALHTQYALSEEYILTLAAYLAEKKKLTTSRLVDEALKLADKDINTTEELELYIKDKESESAIEREIRKVIGYERKPSEKERAFYKKWSSEYGYFTEIIGEAREITVNATGRDRLSYMDKVLTDWHSAGCRTLSECRLRTEEKRKEEANKRRKSAAMKKTAEAEKNKPRYGSFDVKDAFKRALERSYGKDENKEGE